MQQASLQEYHNAALLPLPDGITAAFMASQPDAEVGVMLQELLQLLALIQQL
jgi:hypothetical protein